MEEREDGRELTDEERRTVFIMSRAESYFSQTNGMGDSFKDTYQIDGVIGSGSGGVVIKAYHKRLKKPVVLKKMKVPYQSIEENRREADILKRLRHSHLPGVMDFIDISGEIYTVMDYIEGDTLANWLKKGRVFTQDESVKYGSQLLEALVYLHGQPVPVLHGDIKPSNIMLTPEGNICLIDFNISGYLSDGNSMVAGYTPGYAAPEQEQAIQELMRSRHPVRTGMISESADIYSAGAVIFTILTGKKPGKEWDDNKDLLKTNGISDGIIYVLKKALSVIPEERYHSATKMLEDLKNYIVFDNKYRRKAFVKRAVFLVFAGIVVALIFLLVNHFKNEKVERMREYQNALSSIDSIADDISTEINGKEAAEAKEVFNKALEGVKEYYDLCVDIYPNRAAPVTAMARFFYEAGQYSECRYFIRKNLVQDMADSADGEESIEYGKMYYLLANCYNHEEKYDEAAQAFALAIGKDGTNADYYRDYAACLIKCGESMRAEEILVEAVEKGIGGSQVLLLQGEILLNQERYEEAAVVFEDCIQITEEKGDLLAAYLNAAKAYEKMGNGEENMKQAAKILEDAKTAVATDERFLVFEALAQAYIDLYDITGKDAYANEGAAVCREIIKKGWATVLTYNNIVILLQETGDLHYAHNYVKEMLSKFPDDYRSYKRAAFYEIAVQGKKEIENRDYREFKGYYQEMAFRMKGVGLAEKDEEVGLLKDAYDQLDKYGWLDQND